MGLPIYQIKMYQNATRITNIPKLLKNPQICPTIWKTLKVCKNNQQNLKKYQNIRATLAVLRNGSSNLQDSNALKGSAHNKTYQHDSKFLKLVLAIGKHQMSAKRISKAKLSKH